MVFTKTLDIELILIGLFFILYILYLFRLFRVYRQMHSSSNVYLFKLVLRTIYFALIIIALLGPSFGEMKKEVKAIGKDIYIAVDLSQSMDAVDVQPSRLEKVKFELKNIVNAFSSDRIGLIIFSSDAFIQCPLTYDNGALMLFIETLNTSLVSNAGTDFSPPLRIALEKHLEDSEQSVTRQQSKIIILVSDGEDFGEETSGIASQIKSNDIKLFTLGVGTAKGSKIPSGYRYKRDKQGNDVVTTLNDNALKTLSSMTNGKYFEISDQRNDVARMINSINLIEGELRNSQQVDAAANKYYYFLFAALLLIVLDTLTTVKVVKI